jgi:hypothetical protein
MIALSTIHSQNRHISNIYNLRNNKIEDIRDTDIRRESTTKIVIHK